MAEKNRTALFVVGLKQTRKAVCNETACRVLLAENADPALTETLQELCGTHGVPVRWVPSMKELGRACGLTVGAAAAAILAE